MGNILRKLKLIFTTKAGFLRFAFIMSVLGVVVFILDYGYDQTELVQHIMNGFYFLVILVGATSTFLRHFIFSHSSALRVKLFDLVTVLFSFVVIFNHFYVRLSEHPGNVLYNDLWINVSLVFTFIREFAERNVIYRRRTLNPAQLFIISFISIILLGASILKLPNATYDGITFVDALFTSTSAVCVTGLITVDTGTYFTEFGQIIILILIQIGGLGILTFASYFSYFFKGGTSYENQITIGEMTNAQKLGEVFSIIKRILIITVTVELLGAVLIYSSIDAKLFGSFVEQAFFSVFHSVSAFCNAGFSTFSNGLYEEGVRFNYWLQLIIILLFVLGGLGFPITVNIIKYMKYFIRNKVFFFIRGNIAYRPWVLNLNSRITLITTISLTVVGTILFFVSEYHGTLAAHDSFFGKIVTSLFGAATPRTAGFNTIDMASLSFPTVMIVILLMWIGASPASTGGGIKTSTFAIAILNFVSLARGKDRIEIFRREISNTSVRRAFAVISLSLLVIGVGIVLISVFEKDKDLLSIAFECFSAYSTVGLTLGITSELTVYSKFVIIIIMFVGRVSMLSILIAIFRKAKHKNYRYPTEEISIN